VVVCLDNRFVSLTWSDQRIDAIHIGWMFVVSRWENTPVREEERCQHTLMMSHSPSIFGHFSHCDVINNPWKIEINFVSEGNEALWSDPFDYRLAYCHDSIRLGFLVQPMAFCWVLRQLRHFAPVFNSLECHLMKLFLKLESPRSFIVTWYLLNHLYIFSHSRFNYF